MKHKKGKIWGESKERLTEIVKESKSYSDILRKLGLLPVGSNRYNLQSKILMENIDDSHLKNNSGCGWAKGRIIINESVARTYFTENCKTDNGSLKKYILRFKMLDYICKNCGSQPVWNGKPLTLELDHINGIKSDCRLENFRFLCPNCHSQEPTSNVRKSKKSNKISIEEIKSVIEKSNSKRDILLNMGKSDNSSNHSKLNTILSKLT